MDTKENKQVVMEGYRLFQSGDIRKLLDLYHDDAEWAGPESDLLPFAGTFHGKAGIAEFFSKLNAAARPQQFEPAQFVAEGDKVVASGRAVWLAIPTGRSYASAWVHIFTLRDGKVSRFEAYYDTAAAEKAFHPELAGQASVAAILHH